MTIQLTQDGLPPRGFAMIAIAYARGLAQSLRSRLRRAAELRAARKRRRRRLALHPLHDRIYADLAQARAELEFTYRNNLDRY